MKKIWILLFLLAAGYACATEGVDINSASLSELDKITGIGLTYAQRIIDSRPYSSVDDLLKVKGIGEKTLEKIKEQGLACVNCSSTEEDQTNQTSENIIDKDSNSSITTTYSSGIFINEILPNPDGADEENEYIELYNSNNLEVDLFDWKISDDAGTITIYTISNNAKIPPNGFLVFKRQDTKITLNNDGDKITIFTPDGNARDSASFSKAPLGQSYSRNSGNFVWSTTQTPGTMNIITGSPAKLLPESKKSVKNNNGAGLAGLSSNLNTNQEEIKNTNPWFLFFIALTLTVISATAVLFIKFKLNKNNVRT